MTNKNTGYHPGGSVPRGRSPTTRRRPFRSRRGQLDEGTGGGTRSTARSIRRRPTVKAKEVGNKLRSLIPTRRVAKPQVRKDSSPAAIKRNPLNQNPKPPTTQTSRQKLIAGAKARSQAKIAAIRKKYNSLTPAQKTAMKQRHGAKALTPKPTSRVTSRPTQKLGAIGRTVYNSRTTIPTRPTARPTAKPARGRVR